MDLLEIMEVKFVALPDFWGSDLLYVAQRKIAKQNKTRVFLETDEIDMFRFLFVFLFLSSGHVHTRNRVTETRNLLSDNRLKRVKLGTQEAHLIKVEQKHQETSWNLQITSFYCIFVGFFWQH